MVDCREPRMRVGWPSGEWGSLPLEGGIEVGHSAELRQIENEQGPEAKKAKMEELETMYKRLMNPVSVVMVLECRSVMMHLYSLADTMIGANRKSFQVISLLGAVFE